MLSQSWRAITIWEAIQQLFYILGAPIIFSSTIPCKRDDTSTALIAVGSESDTLWIQILPPAPHSTATRDTASLISALIEFNTSASASEIGSDELRPNIRESGSNTTLDNNGDLVSGLLITNVHQICNLFSASFDALVLMLHIFFFNYDAKFSPNIMQICPKLHQKSAFYAPLQKIEENKVP